jgi:hypothetical protein
MPVPRTKQKSRPRLRPARLPEAELAHGTRNQLLVMAAKRSDSQGGNDRLATRAVPELTSARRYTGDPSGTLDDRVATNSVDARQRGQRGPVTLITHAPAGPWQAVPRHPRPQRCPLAEGNRGAAQPHLVDRRRTREPRRNASRALGPRRPRGWTRGTARGDHPHPCRRRSRRPRASSRARHAAQSAGESLAVRTLRRSPPSAGRRTVRSAPIRGPQCHDHEQRACLDSASLPPVAASSLPR